MDSWSSTPAQALPIGVQLPPSLSLYDRTEHSPSRPPANVRPVTRSVARIGSMLITLFCGVTSVQVGLPFASITILSVLVPDWYISVPVLPFTPSEGSPAVFEANRLDGAARLVN